MRRLLPILTILLLPALAAAQSVTLPPALVGTPGQPTIVMPSKVDGGAPKYVVPVGLKDVTSTLTASAVNWRAFMADKPGVFKVCAYNAKGDVASDLATCTLTIGNGTPVVDPVGDSAASVRKDMVAGFAKIDKALISIDLAIKELQKNPPPVVAKVARVTFVVFAPTPDTAKVTEPKDFRDWMKSQGISLFGVVSQKELDELPKFVAANITSPSIVLQDSTGYIIAVQPITTQDNAKALITKYLK